MQISSDIHNSASQTRTTQTRATFSGALTGGLMEAIRRFASMTTPFKLEFQPFNLSLHLERGFLVGSSGGEPLGQILLRDATINEAVLSEALRVQNGRSFGMVLSQAPFFVPHQTIRNALERQMRGVIDRLLTSPPTHFSFYRRDVAAPLQPRISVAQLEGRILEPDPLSNETLPLFDAWRMGLIDSSTALTPDEWALCRVLNGRRTLAQALERFAALENGIPRARKAAQSLFERNLLEPSAVAGLRVIVVSRKRDVGAAYHPPAGMIANLFLRQLDGVQDAHRVGAALQLEPDKAAGILAGLYRDAVVDVVRGQLELQRLLEDY